MNLNLNGRTALVCGSTQGLGFASAQEISLLGAEIILMAREEQKLKDTLPKLDTGAGQKHSYLVADFQYPDQVKKAIGDFVAKNNAIHILVNNTGGPKGGSAWEANPEDFTQAFNSHLICSHLLLQAVLPAMKAAGYGRIVNIISTSVKEPLEGLGVSNTIRAAVAAWSKTLAGELGQFGITVNNVLPGHMRTARYDAILTSRAAASGKDTDEIEKDYLKEVPVRKIGMPAEFGAAVAFLCSPAASYITGINLPVDGGRLRSL